MTSILIINWNGARYIPGCLDSILARVTVPYEVIVVDNNSTDGSADLIAERYPWVQLVRGKDNLGFAGGNNLAAARARGKHLLLLNNDTVLQTDIADAVLALDADERIGAVGAAMFAGDGTLRQSCQRFPTPARLWYFAGLLCIPTQPWPSPSTVQMSRCDIVEGSFLLTPASLWRRIGGLDERNFMYGEDVDYCRALYDIGLYTVYCPSVRYTHFGGYDHSKLGYFYGGIRRYHRKFSSRWGQRYADFVLRAGLMLRIPLYWLRAITRRDQASRSNLEHFLRVYRNWNNTLVNAHRFHS